MGMASTGLSSSVRSRSFAPMCRHRGSPPSWSSWALAWLGACAGGVPSSRAGDDELPVVRRRCEVRIAAGTGARCELCGDASALAALLRELGAEPPPECAPGDDDDVLVVLPADGVGAASLSLATEEGVDVLTFVAAASARDGRLAQLVVLPRRRCQLAVVWRHASPALGEHTLRVFVRDGR